MEENINNKHDRKRINPILLEFTGNCTVKILKYKLNDKKSEIIILSTIPIWQPNSICQKTIEQMSLETPIREHSIPQDPKFEKRQID